SAPKGREGQAADFAGIVRHRDGAFEDRPGAERGEGTEQQREQGRGVQERAPALLPGRPRQRSGGRHRVLFQLRAGRPKPAFRASQPCQCGAPPASIWRKLGSAKIAVAAKLSLGCRAGRRTPMLAPRGKEPDTAWSLGSRSLSSCCSSR